MHHLRLVPSGVTFSGQRPPGEEQSEFLASTDPWFRPVQAITGPDGALWVVDMYRYVIEHPRWIPPELLGTLDVRAGQTMGRIYRVFANERPPRTAVRFDKLDTAALAAALDSPNGWQRDIAQQMLVWRSDQAAAAPLRTLLRTSGRPETRLHALCTLDGLGVLRPEDVLRGLSDAHAGVRRQTIRLSESLVDPTPEVIEALLKSVDDEDSQVQLQLACTLGECRDPRAAATLSTLALKHAHDPYRTSAVLSSIHRGNLDAVLGGVLSDSTSSAVALRSLLPVAAGIADVPALSRLLDVATASPEDSHKAATGGRGLAAQLEMLEPLLDALDRRRVSLRDVTTARVRQRIEQILTEARGLAINSESHERPRIAAVRVLGRHSRNLDDDLSALSSLLAPQTPAPVQAAAIETLGKCPAAQVPELLLAAWPSYSPTRRGAVLDVLLTRSAGTDALLKAIEQGRVPAAQIDATRREQLLRHRTDEVRRQAERLFAGATAPDRQQVLEDYQDVGRLSGDRQRGKAVFAKACAACHKQDGVGYAVGPDLAGLPNRSPQALLVSILDPSRNVDQRYVQYVATTTDGRTLAGLLAAETGTSITLRGQEAKDQVVLRGEIDQLQSTGKSLMPDGLERNLDRQELADLLVWLADAGPPAAEAFTGHESAEVLAKKILDPQTKPELCTTIIQARPDIAAELVAAMTADLPGDMEEEYRRIPWIWRVAIAAGKRNDSSQIRRLLEVSLPQSDRPLRDWQAVVIGGGIINGISQTGAWPAERIAEILQGHDALTVRWQRALELASPMSDDTSVRAGTRYDALRMLGVEPWNRRGKQLSRYLAKGTHDELQMGAISGLSDVQSPLVASALLEGLDHYSPRNRGLALDALLRDDSRIAALLDAIASGKLSVADLGQQRRDRLLQHSNRELRDRATILLK